MRRHPDSELAGVARQRVAQLTEQAAWQRATRANTAAAYQDYLTKYPNGSWSQDARIRMESKSLAQAPQDAAAVTAGAGQRVMAPAPAAAADQPNSAIQLGAFSSDANARSEWRQLSFRFRAQLDGLTPAIVPVTLSGRRLYRLEVRVASQSVAQRLCRQLQQHSQGCLPLP
jgi:cell division septation protein DedD